MVPVHYVQFLKIITTCMQYFTHVYVMGDGVMKLKLDNMKRVKNNKNNDPPGLYCIDTLYKNIKFYSLKLNVNLSAEEHKLDKTYNVHVDYIHVKLTKNYKIKNLETEMTLYIKMFFQHENELQPSLAVVDLDDTLINREGDILVTNLKQYLRMLNSLFDFVILWSHGCQNHVNFIFETVMAPYKPYFKEILARNSTFEIHNKGLGCMLKYMNIKHGICELNYTLLIDDQSENYNRDYDFFIHAPTVTTQEKHSERMWILLNELRHNLMIKI